MKQRKSFYQSLSFNGFSWAGFWDGVHNFQKRVNNGYEVIKCTDEDIENGNISFMVEHGLSR